MTKKRDLKALLHSAREADREAAIQCLAELLTSRDSDVRRQGYELFEEGLKEALYQSCLNYGSLTGGFTHPLVTVVLRTVEAWADDTEREDTGSTRK